MLVEQEPQRQQQEEEHRAMHVDEQQRQDAAASSSCSSSSGTSAEGPQAGEQECESSPGQQPATLYTVLGVNITASADNIRSAYRRLARLWHPDRHRGDEDAKRKFQEVQGAYEVLSDQARRHEYDLNLLEHLDVEEYLSRFQGLILTACGLGMSSRESSLSDPLDMPLCHLQTPTGVGSPHGPPSSRSRWCLLKAS